MRIGSAIGHEAKIGGKVAFHIYKATLVKEEGASIEVKLDGCGIPHSVTGTKSIRDGLVAINLQRAVNDQGTELMVYNGDTVFFDRQRGRASYDLATLQPATTA